MSEIEYGVYLLAGTLVRAEPYDDAGEWDVSPIVPDTLNHIPEGRGAVRVYPVEVGQSEAWWMWADEFAERAERVSACDADTDD